MEKIKLRVLKSEDVRFFHDSRKNIRTLSKIINLLVDKVNELVDKNNELEENEKTFSQTGYKRSEK